jgi:hypothetical protein
MAVCIEWVSEKALEESKKVRGKKVYEQESVRGKKGKRGPFKTRTMRLA